MARIIGNVVDISLPKENNFTKTIDAELEEILKQRKAILHVIGVGGAGINSLSRMVELGIEGINTIAVDSDASDLLKCHANKKVILGQSSTRGHSTGSNPPVGQSIALEEEQLFRDLIRGADCTFITAGLGRGMGTGGAPVIAKVSKDLGILTICIVTTPFEMEGALQASIAKDGIEQLTGVSDTLIIIPNDKLLEIVPNVPLSTAFKVADEILVNTVRGIVELITKPGIVNLDFADIRTIMESGGLTMIGMGESDSDNRAQDAVEKAINNPLLDTDINGGKGALINIIGGHDMTLEEAKSIVDVVSRKLDPNAPIIWGTQLQDDLKNIIRVLVIITGVSSSDIFRQLQNKIPDTHVEKLQPVRKEMAPKRIKNISSPPVEMSHPAQPMPPQQNKPLSPTHVEGKKVEKPPVGPLPMPQKENAPPKEPKPVTAPLETVAAQTPAPSKSLNNQPAQEEVIPLFDATHDIEKNDELSGLASEPKSPPKPSPKKGEKKLENKDKKGWFSFLGRKK